MGGNSRSATSSIGISGRGARGGSVERGRGRGRGGSYHSALSYQRSSSLYDEDTRGGGRIFLVKINFLN